MAIDSPCVKICSIDPVTDSCVGCGRSRREIAGWSRMSDEEKAFVVAASKERLGSDVHAGVLMDCATCGACSGRDARA